MPTGDIRHLNHQGTLISTAGTGNVTFTTTALNPTSSWDLSVSTISEKMTMIDIKEKLQAQILDNEKTIAIIQKYEKDDCIIFYDQTDAFIPVDVNNWCFENNILCMFDELELDGYNNLPYIQFKTAEDAMAFKLKWI